MADLPRGGILVPHDAYQYFGQRYDVPAVGTISLSDAASPNPAQIAELCGLVREYCINCVLSDSQTGRESVGRVLFR